MLFAELLARLPERVRMQIHNGELTERGLARLAGLSQPHIHNVLSGQRILTVSVADRILTALDLSLSDLWSPLEQRPDAGMADVRNGRAKKRRKSGGGGRERPPDRHPAPAGRLCPN